jgi:hypothetical protein
VPYVHFHFSLLYARFARRARGDTVPQNATILAQRCGHVKGVSQLFSTFFRWAKHAFSLGFFAIIAQYAAFTRTKKPPSADANDGFFWSFFARHFADCV